MSFLQSRLDKGKIGFLFHDNRAVGIFSTEDCIWATEHRKSYIDYGYETPWMQPTYHLNLRRVLFTSDYLGNSEGVFNVILPVMSQNEPFLITLNECILLEFSRSFHLDARARVDDMKFVCKGAQRMRFPFPFTENLGSQVEKSYT